MFDQGKGPPVVVVPGLQGRWEWAKPALSELARTCRTISYTLSGDIGSGVQAASRARVRELHPAARGRARSQPASSGRSSAACPLEGSWPCGMQRATRDRVSALILASAPGPGWQPSAQQADWLSRPWWSAPAFVATSPLRVWPEVSAALPHVGSRLAFLARQGLRCLAAPMIPPLMAARVKCAAGIDFDDDCRRVASPTLVVSGEEPLDRVVPVGSTRSLRRADSCAPTIASCRSTGHMAILTRPSMFAGLVSEFAHAHHH